MQVREFRFNPTVNFKYHLSPLLSIQSFLSSFPTSKFWGDVRRGRVERGFSSLRTGLLPPIPRSPPEKVHHPPRGSTTPRMIRMHIPVPLILLITPRVIQLANILLEYGPRLSSLSRRRWRRSPSVFVLVESRQVDAGSRSATS